MIIRPASPDDITELCVILNEIIQTGGTTAIETPLSHQDFRDYFLSGPDHICCYVAEADTGNLIGFQAMEHHHKLPRNCADIATFAKQTAAKSGIGTALFQHTLRRATQTGLKSINATIRQDNALGIAYYSKMGFTDHSIAKAIPLQDGTKVDRISKRYTL
jgi:L-amino acid N-acyltransferase YncA